MVQEHHMVGYWLQELAYFNIIGNHNQTTPSTPVATAYGIVLYNNGTVSNQLATKWSQPIYQVGKSWNGTVQRVHAFAQQVRPIQSGDTTFLSTYYSNDGGTTYQEALSLGATYGLTTHTFGIDNSTPQFTLDVNGNARIVGANNLYFGGTASSAVDYSHSINNSSGNLIFKPRVDATTAIQFQNAAGTTNILSIDTTNKAVLEKTVYGSFYADNISLSVSGTSGNFSMINGSMSGGTSNLFTFTNNRGLTASYAGKYMVNYSLSVNSNINLNLK